MGKQHKGNYEENDKVREGTQEGLDEYIRVSRPSVLVVIISLLVVLVAVIVWGLLGTLPVTETVTGVVIDPELYGVLEQADVNNMDDYTEIKRAMKQLENDPSKILIYCFVDASRFNGQAIEKFGDEAIIKMPDQKQFKGVIRTSTIAPISTEEAKVVLFDNQWVTEECVAQSYNWWLIIEPLEDLSDYVFTLADVTLLTEEVAPIQFLMR